MPKRPYIFDQYPISKDYSFDYFEPNFEWYFDTAEKILGKRTEEEIELLICRIDDKSSWILDWDNPIGLDEVLKDPASLYPTRNQVLTLLHSMRQKENPSELFRLPDLTWVECFAAALLANTIFAAIAEERFGTPNGYGSGDDYYYDKGELMGNFAVSCQEILSVIGSMPGHDGYILPNRALTAEAQKKAGDKRYELDREIKELCRQKWQENETLSKSKLVDIFILENQEIISKTNWKNPKRVLVEDIYKLDK